MEKEDSLPYQYFLSVMDGIEQYWKKTFGNDLIGFHDHVSSFSHHLAFVPCQTGSRRSAHQELL